MALQPNKNFYKNIKMKKFKYTIYKSPLFVLQGICILNSDDILEVVLVEFSIFCLNLKVTYHIVLPTTMWKSPKSWVFPRFEFKGLGLKVGLWGVWKFLQRDSTKSFVHFQISTSSLKVFFVIKEKPLECVITCMHSLLKDFCKITKSKDVAWLHVSF